MFEQAGTPASRQDAVGKQEAGEIEQLAHIVFAAKMIYDIGYDRLSIAARQPGRSADAQMIIAVFVQKADDRAAPEHSLDDDLSIRIAVEAGSNVLAHARVVDVTIVFAVMLIDR